MVVNNGWSITEYLALWMYSCQQKFIPWNMVWWEDVSGNSEIHTVAKNIFDWCRNWYFYSTWELHISHYYMTKLLPPHHVPWHELLLMSTHETGLKKKKGNIAKGKTNWAGLGAVRGQQGEIHGRRDWKGFWGWRPGKEVGGINQLTSAPARLVHTKPDFWRRDGCLLGQTINESRALLPSLLLPSYSAFILSYSIFTL